MDEVWGVARHPGQAQLLHWMVLFVLVGLLCTGVGFLLPGPPEPSWVPLFERQVPMARGLAREQWLELLRSEELLRLDQFFMPAALEEDLLHWKASVEAYEQHERRIGYVRGGALLCAGVLLWLGAQFVKRRPIPVVVKLHQLQVDGVILPWSQVRAVALGEQGCRVETCDGQVLLQGYVIEDKGELQRAAAVAMGSQRERQGAVPPEMAALRGKLPERIRQ